MNNMSALRLFFLYYVHLYILRNSGFVKGQDTSNMVIEEFYWCKNLTEQRIKYFVNIKDFNPGFQLLDINMSIPSPVGNENLGKATLEFNANTSANSSWIPLVVIEGEMCKTLARYMGEVWYDIQTALGIMRHSCPLPRGSFHAINHRVDFQKLRLQTFPLGETKVTLEILTKNPQETLMCITYILSNKRSN